MTGPRMGDDSPDTVGLFEGTPRVTYSTMTGTDGTLNVQEPVDSGSEEAGVAETQIGQTKRIWYRSVPFQIAVASGVSFTAPGM
jgi:hypothetical protein